MQLQQWFIDYLRGLAQGVAKADAQKMRTELNFVVLEAGEEHWGCRSPFGDLSTCAAFPSDPLS